MYFFHLIAQARTSSIIMNKKFVSFLIFQYLIIEWDVCWRIFFLELLFNISKKLSSIPNFYCSQMGVELKYYIFYLLGLSSSFIRSQHLWEQRLLSALFSVIPQCLEQTPGERLWGCRVNEIICVKQQAQCPKHKRTSGMVAVLSSLFWPCDSGAWLVCGSNSVQGHA